MLAVIALPRREANTSAMPGAPSVATPDWIASGCVLPDHFILGQRFLACCARCTERAIHGIASLQDGWITAGLFFERRRIQRISLVPVKHRRRFGTENQQYGLDSVGMQVSIGGCWPSGTLMTFMRGNCSLTMA